MSFKFSQFLSASVLAVSLGIFMSPTADASQIVTLTDSVPAGTASGGSGSGIGSLSVSSGMVSSSIGSSATLPITYTISNLDLTSCGGSATEQVVVQVAASATGGGSPVFSGFGNIATSGGGNVNQIVGGTETLTTTVSLVSTTFADLTLDGFTTAFLGAFIAGEEADVNGTAASGGTGTQSVAITGNSITVTPSGTTSPVSLLNLQGFSIQLTAVPEPTSFAVLFGLAAPMLLLLRRKR